MLVTRRRIPLDRADEYARLWHDVRDTAFGAGARAWIFGALRADDLFTEFVEWQSAEDQLLIDQLQVADALSNLDSEFPSESSETWIEATI